MSDFDEEYQQSVIEHRECFEKEMGKFYEGREQSLKRPWTRQRYQEVLNHITKEPNQTAKTNKEYYYSRKFDTIDINGEKTLILKRKTSNDPLVKVIRIDEYFDVLFDCHASNGHAGRDRMVHALQKRYVIPKPIVELFVKTCHFCHSKKSSIRKPLVKLKDDSCGMVFFLDFQSFPDNRFTWLLAYVDKRTKFILLRPLEALSYCSVALELLKIILEIGPPKSISLNAISEFSVQVMKELNGWWNETLCLKLEDFNKVEEPEIQIEVERQMGKWLEDNKTSSWSLGCRFVQYILNTTCNTSMRSTPFRAFFGREAFLVGTKTNALVAFPTDMVFGIDQTKVPDDFKADKSLDALPSTSHLDTLGFKSEEMDYLNLHEGLL